MRSPLRGVVTVSCRVPPLWRRDLERLRRIVFYRELGLDLETIRRVLDDPNAAVLAVLRDRQNQLAARVEHLSALVDDLAKMVVDAQEHGLLMTAEEHIATFGPGWDPQWPAKALQLYGDMREWRHYAERSALRRPQTTHDAANSASACGRRPCTRP